MFEVKGKVALVTGGASGIGLACAKELLRNELKGVSLVDVNEENGQQALADLQKEFGENSAIFVRADVSNKVQLEEAFEKTVQTFKQLDILLNNAGIINEVDWEKCLAVNLGGVITGTNLAIQKYFPKYKSGSEALILNTSSGGALRPFEGVPIYCSSKSAVVTFTRTMGGALHYKATGVRVVAICPSATETPIFDIKDTQIEEPYLSLMLNALKLAPGIQTPEELAKKFLKVIKDAPTGSVWFATEEDCIEVNFPKF